MFKTTDNQLYDKQNNSHNRIYDNIKKYTDVPNRHYLVPSS